MDASVSKLVESEMDVNTLKISNCLEIRKKESNIRYMFENFRKYSRSFMFSLTAS